MSVFQKIKDALLAYRKAKEKENAAVLSTLVGDLERTAGKEPTDDQCYAMIKKFIANAETVKGAVRSVTIAEQAQNEIDLLSIFLPKEFPVERIEEAIKQLPAGAQIKDAMQVISQMAKDSNMLLNKGLVSSKFKEMRN